MTASLLLSPKYFSARTVDRSPSQPATLLNPLPPHRSLPVRLRTTRFSPTDDGVSQFVMVGLMAATLLTVAYSLLQTWNIAAGDALHQAIRAFFP